MKTFKYIFFLSCLINAILLFISEDNTQLTYVAPGNFLRNYRTIKLTEVSSRRIEFKAHFSTQFENHLYIINDDEQYVLIFDSILNLKSSLKYFKFENIQYVEVDSNKICILDLNKPAFFEFDKSFNLIKETTFDTYVHGVTNLNDSIKLVLALNNDDKVSNDSKLYYYSTNIKGMNRLKQATPTYSFVHLTGRFIQNKKHKIFFYFFTGDFEAFDDSGNYLYTNKTIDSEFADPKNLKISKRGIIVDKSNIDYISSGALDDGKIYFLSKIPAKNEVFSKTRYLDVYREKDGVYLYSFKIPNNKNTKIKNFSINKNKLVVIYESEIIKYKIGQ